MRRFESPVLHSAFLPCKHIFNRLSSQYFITLALVLIDGGHVRRCPTIVIILIILMVLNEL